VKGIVQFLFQLPQMQKPPATVPSRHILRSSKALWELMLKLQGLRYNESFLARVSSLDPIRLQKGVRACRTPPISRGLRLKMLVPFIGGSLSPMVTAACPDLCRISLVASVSREMVAHQINIDEQHCVVRAETGSVNRPKRYAVEPTKTGPWPLLVLAGLATFCLGPQSGSFGLPAQANHLAQRAV